MARIYSSRFIRAQLTPGASIGFSMDDGLIYVIRQIMVHSFPAPAGGSVAISLTTGEFWSQSFPSNWRGQAEWQGRKVVEGPDTLVAGAIGDVSSPNVWNVYVGGYTLTP